MEDTLIEAIDIYHLRDYRGVGFVKRGLNHICQDAVYFIAKPPGFIVADGVTNPAAKSVSQMVHLVCMRLLELIDHYPSLSIVYAIEVANSFIRVINENENPDERLGMVLSIALIDKENESVEISWVGDCGIQVLDEENHLRLQSIDQVSAASQYLDSLGFRAAVDRRCYAQKHIRNNPYACDRDGKCIGFGVLDGDTRAASFISQKSISISKGWRVLGYSDGFCHLLNEESLLNTVDLVSRRRRPLEALPILMKSLIKKRSIQDELLFSDDMAAAILFVD